MGGDWYMNFFLGGGGWVGGESPKKGASIVCRFKRGLCKRRGYIFEVGGRVETPMHTMSWRNLLIDTNIQSK